MSRVVRSTPPPARWRGSTIWSERMGRALRSQSPNSPWSRPPRQAEVQEKRVKAAPPGPREISMRKMLLAAALLLPAFAASPAAAQEKVSMKCPVGGASFNYVRPARGAVVGLRPDGRPYGDSVQPAPLPECPDNGLVLYKDYEPDEVEKLAAFVGTDAYKALRQNDTQYYRAYKLMREMGEGPDDYLWALLQATWEADGKPALRKRYQEELVSASSDVPARTGDITWIGLEGRVIDALRELGRFDEASAKLAKIPML